MVVSVTVFFIDRLTGHLVADYQSTILRFQMLKMFQPYMLFLPTHHDFWMYALTRTLT